MTLLRRRPDLALPAPTDLATLASRLSVRTSVQRAVDQLPGRELHLLEALTLVASPDGRTAGDRAAALLPELDDDQLGTALDELRDLGLVWGPADALRLVAGVGEALGPYPAGLGRPAASLFPLLPDAAVAGPLAGLGLPPGPQPAAGERAAAALRDPDRVRAALEQLPDAEREVVTRLAAGPPIGVARDARAPASDGDQTPPRRLVAAGLLVAIDNQTVELPREVGLVARGDRPLGPRAVIPPEVPVHEPDVDGLGAATVTEFVRLVEALAEAWSTAPPGVLRSGGLGVRELRRTALSLDVPEPTAALVAEIAWAAGLVGMGSAPDPTFLPTGDYDAWLRRDPATRWTALAGAWLGMTRQPSAVGRRDERERVVAALGPDAERGILPGVRRLALEVLAGLPVGAAPVERGPVLARIGYAAPRRAAAQRPLVEAVLDEADLIGVTAAGGLTSYGRALLAGDEAAMVAALDAALPEPVEEILVQPDLTVVVPGQPSAELARELRLVADLESTGGAQVYRIGESTVRRALDAGRTAAQVAALFARASRTPVPQALSYLIEDSARRHGVLRTGSATSYLRCDDEALLARVVSDRAVLGLDLRLIAPTVVVSAVPPARLLDVLREAGYSPAAESAAGEVVTLRSDPARAASRPTSRLVRARAPGPPVPALGEAVRRMRAGDALAEVSRRSSPLGQRVPGVTTAGMLELLRDAIRGERRIWLDHVDSQGRSSQRALDPISMAGGTLRGYDPDTNRLESFALHHITAVSVLPD